MTTPQRSDSGVRQGGQPSDQARPERVLSGDEAAARWPSPNLSGDAQAAALRLAEAISQFAQRLILDQRDLTLGEVVKWLRERADGFHKGATDAGWQPPVAIISELKTAADELERLAQGKDG